MIIYKIIVYPVIFLLRFIAVLFLWFWYPKEAGRGFITLFKMMINDLGKWLKKK